MNTLSFPHPAGRLAPQPLLWVIVLVVALHALLLLSLSWLRPGGTTLLASDALITRVIAPAPEPRQEEPQAQPAPPAPEPPQPAPRPKPPRPKPAPQPKPQPTPAEAPPPAEAAAPQPPEQVSAAADAGPSLLLAPPRATFGGHTLPAAIELPLTPAEAGQVLAVAGAADTTSPAPVRLPRPAVLTYRASGAIGGVPFEGVPTTLDWRSDGNYFALRWMLYSPKFGEQTRASIGLIAPAGLLPVLASLRTPQVHEMRWDYQKQQLSFSDLPPQAAEPQAAASQPQPQEQVAALAPGAQDRLSGLMQVAALVAGDPARYAQPGASIDLPAVHTDHAGQWHFVTQGEEPLQALGGQTLRALHLAHAPQDARDAQLDLWLAPALDELPARVRVTEANGDTVDYTVQSAYTQLVPMAAPPTPPASQPQP